MRSTFFFSSAWGLLFSLMYKYIMFLKSTPKAPANNHTHPCIPLFNWASTFCTLVTSWAMQKPYFQLLKPASEKMSTTYILKDIVLWKPFFFHKIWPRKPMASLPTWSSNVFGCFQYLFSNLQDFSSVTLDTGKKESPDYQATTPVIQMLILI